MWLSWFLFILCIRDVPMTSDELRFVMEKIIRLVSVQFCTFFFLVYLRLLMSCEESGLDIFDWKGRKVKVILCLFTGRTTMCEMALNLWCSFAKFNLLYHNNVLIFHFYFSVGPWRTLIFKSFLHLSISYCFSPQRYTILFTWAATCNSIALFFSENTFSVFLI